MARAFPAKEQRIMHVSSSKYFISVLFFRDNLIPPKEFVPFPVHDETASSKLSDYWYEY